MARPPPSYHSVPFKRSQMAAHLPHLPRVILSHFSVLSPYLWPTQVGCLQAPEAGSSNGRKEECLPGADA